MLIFKIILIKIINISLHANTYSWSCINKYFVKCAQKLHDCAWITQMSYFGFKAANFMTNLQHLFIYNKSGISWRKKMFIIYFYFFGKFEKSTWVKHSRGHILSLNGRDISSWIWLVICSIFRILWLTNQNQADSVVKYLYIMAIKLYNWLLDSQETDYLCCCDSLRSCIILQAFSSHLIK